MKKFVIGFTLLGSLSLAVNAQVCEQKYNSPSDIADCQEKVSFAKVQDNFQKLMNSSKDQLSYNKNVLVELNKSQKAWLSYRDSYCDTYSNYHNEMNNHSNCIVNLNNQRAKQLQEDLNAD